jgi:hypothetical protein
MGVDLEASDLEGLKEQVEELAIHDPDAFEEFKEDLRKFKEGPAVIKSLEEQLAKITDADLEGLKAEHLENTEMLKSLKTIQGHYDSGKLNRAWYSVQRWFSADSDLEQAFASAKEAYLPKDINPDTIRKFIEELTEEVEESGKKIESVENARKMKDELAVSMAESRNQLLSDISDIKGLSEIVSQRAEAQLEALFKEGSVKSLDIAQEKFAKMDEAGSMETLGMDPLANVDPVEIQEYIDKRLTERVKSEVRLAIEDVKLGDGAMSKLTKSLESYIDREELGSKTKEETAEFISSVITEVANSLGDSKEAKIKRMLCARILSKIKK